MQGRGSKEVEGACRDLQGAQLVPTAEVNGELQYEVILKEGTKRHQLCSGLSSVEQRWLVRRINDHLESLGVEVHFLSTLIYPPTHIWLGSGLISVEAQWLLRCINEHMDSMASVLQSIPPPPPPPPAPPITHTHVSLDGNTDWSVKQ